LLLFILWFGGSLPSHNSQMGSQNIKSTLGTHLKFIFMLRNPVERTVSAYWHLYKRFDESRDIEEVLRFDCDDIDGVIRQECERLEAALRESRICVDRYTQRYADFLWPFYYVRNSLYLRQLLKFCECFERKNMLFVFTEELGKEPMRVFKQVARFLDIDDRFIPGNLGKRYNTTRVPKSGKVFHWLHAIANSPLLKATRTQFSFLNKAYQAVGTHPKPSTDPIIEEGLKRVFLEEKRQLCEFLGVDLADIWW
jgi:hypothetical protein